MYSLDNCMNIETSCLSDLSQLDNLIGKHNLCRERRGMPLFSLIDLFEVLLKATCIDRHTIGKKILMLHEYLNSAKAGQFRFTYGQLMSQSQSEITRKLYNTDLFYDNVLLNLFSFAFGLRIEIYSCYKSKISVQHFGLKSMPIKRVLMTQDSYLLLKKSLSKASSLLTKQLGKSKEFNPNFLTRKSPITLNTKVLGDFDMNIELKREASANTGISVKNNNSEGRIEVVEESPVYCSFMEISGLNAIEQQEHLKISSSIESIKTSKENSGSLKSATNLDSVDQSPQTVNVEFGTTEINLNILETNPERTADNQSEGKLTGLLKFYNEAKEYGFIIMDDESEIFVHKADLLKQNIDTRYLAYYKKYYNIVMEFNVQEYQSKAKKHRKAIDVLINDMQAIC